MRYYRGSVDVKNYIRLYYREGAVLGLRGHGTTAPVERYYRGHLWYYRAIARYYRWCIRYYRSLGSSTTTSQHSSQNKVERYKRRMLQGAGERRGLGRNVYVMIPPETFRHGPPLSSTAFLRLKSTKKKCRKTPSSIVFEGHQTVLCLARKRLGNSRHTISPQTHCHQSPKHLRDKYALTISPLLVD